MPPHATSTYEAMDFLTQLFILPENIVLYKVVVLWIVCLVSTILVRLHQLKHKNYKQCYGIALFCCGLLLVKFKTWWRHQMELFSALLAICAGNSPVTGDFPHTKDQWRGAMMFSLNYAWINGWVNTREADDLRRHRAHYYVTVMRMSQ